MALWKRDKTMRPFKKEQSIQAAPNEKPAKKEKYPKKRVQYGKLKLSINHRLLYFPFD